jgi:hypothetical protein
VPNTALVGAVYLLASSIPAMVAVGVASDSHSAIPVVAWGVLGMFTAGGLAFWARRWVGAAVSVVPQLAPGSDAQPVEVSGAVFAAHWGVPYLLALTPLMQGDPDVRALVLAAAVVGATAGMAVWGAARARRVAARRALAVGAVSS